MSARWTSETWCSASRLLVRTEQMLRCLGRNRTAPVEDRDPAEDEGVDRASRR